MTDDKLRQAAEALLAYRKRSGSLNFQLEKADDHFRALREALDAPRQELAWSRTAPKAGGWCVSHVATPSGSGLTLIRLTADEVVPVNGSVLWLGPLPVPEEP
jgi:hypothetical protein